jgi:D-alanyl-D-alanine carboxypeptidase
VPQDDLLILVTLTYALGRDYATGDLIPLSDYLPVDITLGYPTELRQVAVAPLVQMIAAMQAAGMKPFIISGYRSYSAQSIAWNKWLEREPERASQLSAPPGHSEHQLGTTLDFGSPELAEIVGDPDIEFHTYFYQTSEGQWLLEHAHEYGFTLSYSREAFETTGFYYEPWHYRYIGVALATQLKEQGLSLTEYQLTNFPLPCIP